MGGSPASSLAAQAPHTTVDWLCSEENPAVAALTLRGLLGDTGSPRARELWAQRNAYEPVSTILGQMRPDGSWDTPERDYQKYGGNLWQVHFLGELFADGDDERVRTAASYAFSRQLPDGSWSCNGRASATIPCLTANVGRALARLGFARDVPIARALGYCVSLHDAFGCLTCGIPEREGQPAGEWGASSSTLNGYCHMLAPKLLLFLAEVPRDLWPEGAERLRNECVRVLREKEVFRSLPEEAREFFDVYYSAKAAERTGLRERYLQNHPVLHYKPKPGWLRFGYPLSYNSDALEALPALALHGEPARPEYAPSLAAVRSAADGEMRWKLRNSFNGKMRADVEEKGKPSRWITWRALTVLQHYGGANDAVPENVS